MRRKTILVLLLLLLSTSVSGLEASIKNSCGPQEEPLISMYSLNNSHAATPGHFQYQVCVEGERDFNIRDECGPEEVRVFSLFSENNSHISMYSSYTYEVCSKDTRGAVRSSCFSNETAAFSVHSDNNSHVGEVGYYGDNLCLFKQPPKNITLSISGLSGNFQADDDPIAQGNNLRLAEYPYIVAENSGKVRGIVSYTEFVELSRSSSDKISVTQTGPTFLVPFTEGDHQVIEDRQELVINTRFFNVLNPSFGFNIPEQPQVRVALKPDQDVEGFTGTLRNSIEIAVQNRGLKNGTLTIRIEPP